MSEYFFLIFKKNSQILATCGEYFSWQTCQSSVKSFQKQQQFFLKYFPTTIFNLQQPQLQQQQQQQHGLHLFVSISELSLRGASVAPFPGLNL